MRKVKVLFFAADPRLGRPDGIPLELADDLREIKLQVKQARYGHRLVFDPNGAARADDLIDLLENTDARVVHFSGHGGTHGLVFVGPDGYSRHPIDAAALKRLFRTYHGGSVRLAVLSACTSHAEAQAIADVVGCAIGTLNKIGDDAAITFNGRFYRAIGNGHSVQRAYDEACTALQVYGVPESEYPRIFAREDVDAAALVLVKTYRPVASRVTAATISCLVTTAVVAWEPPVLPEPTVSDIACGAISGGRSVQAAISVASAGQHGAAEKLADAKAFYGARKYRAAARAFEEADNAEAMGCLGYMYLSGRGMNSQPVTGFELVHEAALDARDTHAMYALANAYLSGVGTPAREHLARHWFTEAAEKGFPEAMRSLGDLARQKMNDSSYGEALIWYQQAVDAGSLNARVDIGTMYEFGWGVERNPTTALQWYRSAAQAGLPRGLFAIGQSYQKGVGVAQDYDQAMEWYLRAAQAGSADAMNSIGVLYDNGLGVRKSHAKARRWYKRADKAGSTLARGNLGTFERD
jgi:hypothetical protein